MAPRRRAPPAPASAAPGSRKEGGGRRGPRAGPGRGGAEASSRRRRGRRRGGRRRAAAAARGQQDVAAEELGVRAPDAHDGDERDERRGGAPAAAAEAARGGSGSGNCRCRGRRCRRRSGRGGRRRRRREPGLKNQRNEKRHCNLQLNGLLCLPAKSQGRREKSGRFFSAAGGRGRGRRQQNEASMSRHSSPSIAVRFFKLCPCLQGIPKHGRLFFFLPAPPLARPRRPPHAPGAHRRAPGSSLPRSSPACSEGRPRARRRRRRARVRAAQGPGAVRASAGSTSSTWTRSTSAT